MLIEQVAHRFDDEDADVVLCLASVHPGVHPIGIKEQNKMLIVMDMTKALIFSTK